MLRDLNGVRYSLAYGSDVPPLIEPSRQFERAECSVRRRRLRSHEEHAGLLSDDAWGR